MDDLLSHLPRSLATLVLEFGYPCDLCERMHDLLIALPLVEYCGQRVLYVEDLGYGLEGERMEVLRDSEGLQLEYEDQKGTCEECEDYDLHEERTVLSVGQVAAVLAHRLELSHPFRGRAYDLFSPRTHSTVRRSACVRYGGVDELGLRLRCVVLEEVYDERHGYEVCYDDESDGEEVSVPGL